MDLSGNSTWVVSSGGGGTFALYVRDALAISTPAADSIPPLTPPVPRATGIEVPPGFAQEWDHWWRENLGAGRVAGGAEHVHARWPTGLPEQLRDAHAEWAQSRREADSLRGDAMARFSELLNEVVGELEEELGRSPVFALDLIELPVEGEFWRRLGPGTVLISEQLKRSRNVIAPLESVLRDLAEAQ